MKQTLYILRYIETDRMVFKYDNGASNPKKALFNTVKHAENAADKMNEHYETDIVYVDSID